MYYEVNIREILQKTVIVRAGNKTEAREKALTKWHIGEVTLSDRDFLDAEAKVQGRRKDFSLAEMYDNLIGGCKAVSRASDAVLQEMGAVEEPSAESEDERTERIAVFASEKNLRFDDRGRIVSPEVA